MAFVLCQEAVRPACPLGRLDIIPDGSERQRQCRRRRCHGQGGRRSALVVHQKEEPASIDLTRLVPDIADMRTVLKIDDSTNNQIAEVNCEGKLHFGGFGVAVVTTESHKADELSPICSRSSAAL